MDDQTTERESQEVDMVEMFKDILKQIQSDIEREKREREQSQEALLNLMEETCSKLSYQAAI